MPRTLQWCRYGRFRGRNLAEGVAVRRRFRAGVGVFCQTLIKSRAEPSRAEPSRAEARILSKLKLSA